MVRRSSLASLLVTLGAASATERSLRGSGRRNGSEDFQRISADDDHIPSDLFDISHASDRGSLSSSADGDEGEADSPDAFASTAAHVDEASRASEAPWVYSKSGDKLPGSEYFASEEHKYFGITLVRKGEKHFRGDCSATMIGRRWAVTAAHCISNNKKDDLRDKMGSLYLNPFDPWRQDEETGNSNWGRPYQIKDIKALHEHPLHEPGPASSYDVALIELDSDVHEYIETVPIADCSYVDSLQSGEQLEVLGMGQTQFNGPKATHLKEVFVPLVSKEQCRDNYSDKEWAIDHTMVCAGGEGTSDSCRGDSGGPLLHNGNLVGGVSWGYKCAEKGYPGVYSKTCKVLDWIKTFDIEGLEIMSALPEEGDKDASVA